MKNITALFTAVLTITALQSQTPEGDSKHFDSVRVHSLHSDRLSFNSDNFGGSVQVLKREDIKQLPVQTTAELLSYVLGIDLRQRGPMGVQSDIQIQGSSFDQVLVLIDGVRMSDPQTGHHQMNLSISPEAIERIELIKGAAARRYGLNALAGVINIITRVPAKAGAALQMHAGSSAAKNRDGKTYANQSLRFFNAFTSASVKGWFDAAADAGNGYRYNSEFSAIRSNVRLQQTLRHKLSAFKADGIQLNYSASVLRNAFGANGFYAAPSDSNAFEYVNTQWGAVSLEMQTKQSGRITARISGRGNSDQYVFIKQNPTYYRNFHNSTVLNAELNYHKEYKFMSFAAGAEYRKEAINSSNLGEHAREFSGVFTDLLIRPIDWLRLSAGMYMLHNKQFGSRLYPGADINAHLGKGHYAFASAGTGQRLPTYTDWYYKGPGNLGNEQLLPEKAMYADAGLRYNGKHLSYQLSVFRRDSRDLIDRIKDSVAAPWRPVNLQSLVVQGIEARIGYNLRLKRLFAEADQTFIRFSTGISVLEAEQNKLTAISQFSVSYLPLQWISQLQLQQKAFGLGLFLRHVERYGLLDAQRNTYTLLDGRLDYKPRIKQNRPLTVFLSVQNAGNAAYREFAVLPLLPRWYSLGLGWVF